MKPSRPNILFILIDDFGYADLQSYGSTFYETPNLDRLAGQGMRFTDGYAACPVCSPTRASLLTGKYPATVGITNWIGGNPWGRLIGVPYFDALPEGETTIAAVLGDAGYQTWHVGKWHLGGPERYPDRVGFDGNLGGCHAGHPPNGYFAPWKIPTLDDSEDGTYLTDRLTDESVALIESAANSNKPWFMHLSHYAVHTPLQAPQALIEKYERKAEALGLDPQDNLQTGEALPGLHQKGKHVQRRTIQSHPVYAAMIENLDTNVGRTLGALESTGQAENTIVIFTSDNGGLSTAEGSPTCNAPLSEGKGWMYDGGNRVPWIVRWPGRVQAGSVSDATITSPDLFPTLLELAGLDAVPEQHVDGKSFAAALRSEPFERGPIFWHYPHYSNQGGTPSRSVRDGRWKLIEFFEDARLELYDLAADVGEDVDLAGRQPEKTAELHAALQAWSDAVEAKIPEVNPYFDKMVAGEMPCPDDRGLFPDGYVPGDD
ncbi:MAG: sulfatase [Planctomycetota bacterium]